MDAFNPWDLVKNIGRGFRWFFVGRKTRMQDISYQTSAKSTGLEPTRNQLTAFQPSNLDDPSSDGPVPPPYLGSGGLGSGKTGRYQALTDEEDQDRLLTHAQAPPRSTNNPIPNFPYPRPMTRAGGDLGAGTSAPYDPPAIRTHSRDPSASNIGSKSTPDVDDTGYHGAAATMTTATPKRNITPTTIPPDPQPLGPPGRKSHEAREWDMWGGVERGEGESERDLGGGHGVGDNRF